VSVSFLNSRLNKILYQNAISNKDVVCRHQHGSKGFLPRLRSAPVWGFSWPFGFYRTLRVVLDTCLVSNIWLLRLPQLDPSRYLKKASIVTGHMSAFLLVTFSFQDHGLALFFVSLCVENLKARALPWPIHPQLAFHDPFCLQRCAFISGISGMSSLIGSTDSEKLLDATCTTEVRMSIFSTWMLAAISGPYLGMSPYFLLARRHALLHGKEIAYNEPFLG